MEELKNNRFDEALELDDDDKTLSSAELEKQLSMKNSDNAGSDRDSHSSSSRSSEETGSPMGSHQRLQTNVIVDPALSKVKDEMNDTSHENRVQNDFFDVGFDAVDDITSESSSSEETESNSTVHPQNLSPQTQIDNVTKRNTVDISMSSTSKKAPGEANKYHENVDMSNVGEHHADDLSEINVSSDVKELFKYIQLYRPHDVELESTLKCFIPSFIPAVGEPDAFIKPIRPDGKAETLGLKVIDEPSPNQSDTAVLELQLKSLSKKRKTNYVVHSIENAEKNKHCIDNWITSIEELHNTMYTDRDHHNLQNLCSSESALDEDILGHLREGSVVIPPPEIDLPPEIYAKALCLILELPFNDSDILSSVHSLITMCIKNSE